MSTVDQRRRRPATYGSRNRKRLSGIDEIWSSPISTPNPTSRAVTTAKLPPPPAQPALAARPDARRSTTLPTAPTRKNVGSGSAVSNTKASAFQVASLSPESKGELAAAEQLHNEAQQSAVKPAPVRDLFDLPSDSDESEIEAPKPQKRKRAGPSSTKPKPAAGNKAKEASTSDMVPKKRARGTSAAPPASKKQATVATNKITTTVKVSKPVEKPPAPVRAKENPKNDVSSKPAVVAKAPAKKPVVQERPASQKNQQAVSAPKAAVKVPEPPRTRVTRSQSRALSEEPTAFVPSFSQPPGDTITLQSSQEPAEPPRRARSASREPPHAQTSSVTSTVKTKTTFKSKAKRVITPMTSIKEIASTPIRGVEEELIGTARLKRPLIAPEPLLSSPIQPLKPLKPLLTAPKKEPEDVRMGDSDDSDDLKPLPQQRKRLIDALGGGSSRYRKMSRSSSSSGSDSEENSDRWAADTRASKYDSQKADSQITIASQATDILSSQEATIRTLAKQTARAGPRITYARQRSYLAEEPMNELEMLSRPLPSISSSSTGPRRRLGATQASQEETETDSQISRALSMKSIHELRAAGERSRFADDVSELFDDVDAGRPASTRRMGYHVIADKLRDKGFCLQFRNLSFDETLLGNLSDETDEIVCFTVCYIGHVLLSSDQTPRLMLKLLNSGATKMLLRMLNCSRDITAIAKDRKSNISRAAQESVAELREMVVQCKTLEIESSTCVSPRLLSLKLLEDLVRRCRGAESTDDFLPDTALKQLVSIIKPYTTLDAYPKGSKLNDPTVLELALSIMESYTMGDCIAVTTKLTASELCVVGDMLAAFQSWTHDPTINREELIGHPLLLTLRFAINNSNHNAAVANAFATARIIRALIESLQDNFDKIAGPCDSEVRMASIDILVLSFGLLLNLASLSDKARNLIETLKLPMKAAPAANSHPNSQSSSGTESQSPAADSQNTKSCLDTLIQIFLSRLDTLGEASSLDQSTANVPFGYLTVLLGELVAQEDHIRYYVRSQMDIKRLADTFEEFVRHHRKVDNLINGIGMEDDDDAEAAAMGMVMNGGIDEKALKARGDFTARLEGVLKRLKAFV